MPWDHWLENSYKVMNLLTVLVVSCFQTTTLLESLNVCQRPTSVFLCISWLTFNTERSSHTLHENNWKEKVIVWCLWFGWKGNFRYVIETENIPVIDVKGLTEKEEDLQQLAAQIKDAFINIGFVAITNHNVQASVVLQLCLYTLIQFGFHLWLRSILLSLKFCF